MEVTDKDIEPVIEADAKKYNLPVDKIKSVYENNPDVKYRVLDDKLMNFLIENAKIKDVEKHDHSHDDHDHEHDHEHEGEETKKEAKPKKPRKKKAE